MGNSTAFKARRSLKRIGVLLVSFGVFIPLGIFILIFANEQPVGYGFLVFGGIPVIIMTFAVIAPSSGYLVSSLQLKVKKGSKRRQIDFDDISGVKIIAEVEAATIVAEYMRPTMQSEMNLDLKSWFRSSKKYGQFIQFCTVPIVQSNTTAGSPANIVSFGAKSSGDFILMRIGTGEEFLLSPAETGEFFRALKPAIHATADMSAPYPYRTETTDLSSAGKPNRRRNFTKVNLITAAVIIAIVAAVVISRYV